MKCRNCKSLKIKKIISVGKQPLSGIFQKKKNYNLKKYSLDLFICIKCDLVQLGNSPPPKKMFADGYGYQTSISTLMKNHLLTVYKKLKKKKYINKNSSVLDIGSNDGTFLNFFDKTNNLYGIDPTVNKYKKFYKPNIKIINNFFSYKNLKKYLKNSQKKFDLISSFAMFYDVNDPNNFCTDIYRLLTKNGIWVLEFSYFPLLLKNLTYDQICHEHVTYYTLKVFKKIAEKNNLKILNVSQNEINGGSIQIVCSKSDAIRKTYNQSLINNLLDDEKKINNKSYKNFSKRIVNLKKKLKNFFRINKHKLIYGYGASTKGNIILNYCNLTEKNIKFICDANLIKKGLYTPGSNIEITTKEFMRIRRPDYLFILIWSFRKEVIKEEINFIKRGGKLIFVLPRFHIVDISNYKNYLKQKINSQSYKY